MEGLREKVRSILQRLEQNQPPVRLNQVAALFEIRVEEVPLHESVSGLLAHRPNGEVVIGINAGHSETRKRFTLAHELGHYLSGHRELKIIDDDLVKDTLKEREANAFAGELLMPFDMLRADIRTGSMKIPELARRYAVSPQAMSVRLLETGLIGKF